MKRIKKQVIIVVSSSIIVVITLVFVGAYASASADLSLEIGVDRKSYKLGEVVPIKFVICNETTRYVYLSDEAVEKITVQISTDGNNYRSYSGPSRNFTLDGVGTPIKIGPGSELVRGKTVLWNFVPDVSHLNSDAAKPILSDRILTDYAFPRANTYLVKAVLTDNQNGSLIKIESQPIEIVIEIPRNEDLEVWNIIKRNGEFAYFIQEGDITRGYKKPEERSRFLQQISEIVNQHPNSFYAGVLRLSLDKFRAGETERDELIKKMRNEKP
jgi:hypothetical protein